jgi:PIN domain nuclease of toxin-antitoxin system
MIYLLDTHAFIWLDSNDTSLSTTAKQIIGNRIALITRDANITKYPVTAIW